MTELSDYQKTCLNTLKKMRAETKSHMKNCSCHTCIYMRDIESRPDIRAIIARDDI